MGWGGGTVEQTTQLGGCHQVRHVGGLGWSEVAEFKMYFDGRQDRICMCIRCWGLVHSLWPKANTLIYILGTGGYHPWELSKRQNGGHLFSASYLHPGVFDPSVMEGCPLEVRVTLLCLLLHIAVSCTWEAEMIKIYINCLLPSRSS